MTTVQDICIAELICNGISGLNHNQTICRVSDEGYHALLKCIILQSPVDGVEYYEHDGEYPTLTVLFSKIGSDEILDTSYLRTLPHTTQEVESLMKRTFAIKMALKAE